ncbi:MAG TPA: hypothetical protein VGJ03_05560 [Acidimicrobiales bacterium]
MTRRRGDRGQVLGIALAFLTFIVLVLAGTLTLAVTHLKATQTLDQQRSEEYTSEAAVLAAVNRIKGDTTLGTDNPSDPTDCSLTTAANFVNSMQAHVDCLTLTGSGQSATAVNRPPYSVLALPTTVGSTLEGVWQIPTAGGGGGSRDIDVFGPVASNGTISEAGNGASGTLRVFGDVTAHRTVPGNAANCGGQVNVVAPGTTKVCNSNTTIADPGNAGTAAGYTLLASTAPANAPAPTCTTGAAVFSPGTYNAAPVSPAPCASKPMWFQPGNYYFDFTAAGAHVWSLAGKTVIGGTPNTVAKTAHHAFDPNAAVDAQMAMPGLCLGEHDFPLSPGVQFVFGGDTRMDLGTTGKAELCATPSTAAQQIAVYGAMTNAGATVPATESPTTASSVGNLYANPSNALAIGGGSATATVPNKSSASIDLGGFPSLAGGSIVTNVKMVVSHSETTNFSSLAVTLNDNGAAVDGGTFTTSSTTCTANTLCLQNSAHTDTIDVTNLFAQDPTLFSRLSVDLAVATPNPNNTTYTSSLDGIRFDVTLAPNQGGYRAIAGCALVTNDDGSGQPTMPCPLITTGAGANLFVQGTIYAPTAGLDITTAIGDPILLNRGVIARNVVFRIHPGGGSSSINGSVGPSDRFVLLTAKVNGHQRLTTLVEIHDFDDQNNFAPGDSVTYLTWDVR